MKTHRRTFLQTLSAASVAASCRLLAGAPPQTPREVRATSGDAVEPQWEQRLTVTVGPAKADLVGGDHRVLQAAVDYVAALGGGTVHVLPGQYRLRNAVYLRAKVRLLGDGDGSVLRKEPSRTTKLADDSDWYDQEITLADATGFQLGDGVCLRSKGDVAKRTLVGRNGNRFLLDRALRKNFWLKNETTASSLFPILDVENVSDVVIENLVLDGNRAQNENLDGNHAGCIFMQDASRVTVRNVTARDYNGDGISWQVAHDVVVEGCRSHGHAGLGLHPGSGSQRSIMRNNVLRENSIGLFFCWGVRFAVAEGNRIEDSRQYGMSIGHRDRDNLIRKNTVLRSGTAGILFRVDGDESFAPHRNRLEENRIEDSGPETGIGIDVQGTTEGVTLAGNEVRETRGPAKRTGIRISAQTRDLRLEGNRIDGVAVPIADLRKA